MTHKPTPPQSVLHEKFYCVRGKLIRRKNGVGKVAGTPRKVDGRLRVKCNCETYFASRLVWAYYHGDPGDYEVDHIDDNCLNNNIWNLQLLTSKENMDKRDRHYTRTKPMPSGRWGARYWNGTREVWLGTYDTEQEAIDVVTSAT